MILQINDRFTNRRVSYFTNVSIDLKYDAFASTFQLAYYFDPANKEHVEFSCVSHYHICTLLDDSGKRILTGYILSIDMDDSSTVTLVRISGYSLPGVLEDCDIAPTVPAQFTRGLKNPLLPYALQFYNLTLKQLAENLVAPFGIKVVIHPSVATEMNTKYEETEAKENQNIKSFLSELASQKNIIITHNEFGNLVFQRPSARQKPVFAFTPETISNVKMRLSFNGQGVHSQITVMKQSSIEQDGIEEQETLYNPYVTTVFRPKVHKITQKSTGPKDSNEASVNLRAKELQNLGLNIELDRWILNDRLLMPGQIITVTNPRVYLFKPTNWFIQAITLNEDKDKNTATMKCCIPEAITGEEPKYIFAGINRHPMA